MTMLGCSNEIVVSYVAFCALVTFLLGLWLGRLWERASKRNVNGRTAGGGGGAVELYVGNLAYEMSEQDVSKLFERFGRVSGVRIIMKKGDGQSRGYGFVQMQNRDEALAAMRGLNGKEVNGRALVVNEARSRGKGRR